MPRCFSECISRTLAIFHGNEKIRKWFTKWRKADRVFVRHPGGQPKGELSTRLRDPTWPSLLVPLFFSPRKNGGKKENNLDPSKYRYFPNQGGFLCFMFD
jgi:hypothetical protein